MNMLSYNSSPRPLKRVRFDDVVSELCKVPTVANKQDVWYTKAEFMTFTKELRFTIRSLRKHSTLIACLEEAFQFSLSLAGNLVDEYDEETALTRIRFHENLSRWSGNDLHSFRGLEGLSSPLIKCHSNICKEVNSRLGDFVKTGDNDDEDIQRLCASNSRCARIFARLMAECDAKAATATDVRPPTPDLDSDEESCAMPVKKMKIVAGERRIRITAYMHNTHSTVLPRKHRADWSSA